MKSSNPPLPPHSYCTQASWAAWVTSSACSCPAVSSPNCKHLFWRCGSSSFTLGPLLTVCWPAGQQQSPPWAKSHSPPEPWIRTPGCPCAGWSSSPGGGAAPWGVGELMMLVGWFLRCPVRLSWLLCCHYDLPLLHYKQSVNARPSFQADPSFVSEVSL